MRIAIAGGGIAGLATAIALAENGHQIEVLERRAELGELGAGIQIAPNGLRALDRLGVADDVLRSCVRVTELVIRDGSSGEPLMRLPTGEDYESTFGYPYTVVQRSDLYQPLLEACTRHEGIVLRTGAQVVRYANRASAVVVTLRSGEELVVDALVGADGIRSGVRRQLVGDGDPVVSGHTIYRAVIDMDRVPAHWRANRVSLWAGDDWHFVNYPVGGGTKLNLAITRDDGATEEVVGQPVDLGIVLDNFGDAHEQVRGLLALSDAWRSWVLCSRPRLDDWNDGAVVLLGDAAHPMLQYAAQGASMALEDAVTLGLLMPKDVEDVPQAFATLAALRRERTATVQWISAQMGEQVYHTRGRSRAERNCWLRSFTEADMRAALGWLHGSTDFTESGPRSASARRVSTRAAS